MDDVFDTTLPDSVSELGVASRDWQKRSCEVHVQAECDALVAAHEVKMQNEFNFGVKKGFDLLNQSATARGRLVCRTKMDALFHRPVNSNTTDRPDPVGILRLVDELQKSEEQLVNSLLNHGNIDVFWNKIGTLLEESNGILNSCSIQSNSIKPDQFCMQPPDLCEENPD